MLNSVRFIFVVILVQYFKSLSNLLCRRIVFLVFSIGIAYISQKIIYMNKNVLNRAL